MAAVALANTTQVSVLAVPGNSQAHAVWFENRTAATIYLWPDHGQTVSAPTAEMSLPPAAAGVPSRLTIQATGGDGTLVCRAWKAYQASGGSVDLHCGRWK